MEKKRNAAFWWLELLVKFGILTVGFLEASSLTFGKPIISLFLWPTVALGGILLIDRLIHWKWYWKSKDFFLLASILCQLCAVTACEYSLWMVYQFPVH